MGFCIQSQVGIVYGWDYDGIWSSSIPQLSFLIYENIFVECFRSRPSFPGHWISPLSGKYPPPHLFLFFVCPMAITVSPSSSHIPRSSHQSPNRSISLSSLSLSVRVCHHSLFPTVSIVTKATRVPSATILHTIKTISTNTTTTDFLSLAMCSILTRHQTPLLSYANISIILFYLPLSSYFVQSIPSSSSLSSIQAQSPNCTTCPVLSSCLPNHA